MDLTIKNKSGVPTLTLQEDFNVFLRINFSAVCEAIALRGKVFRSEADFILEFAVLAVLCQHFLLALM